MTSYLHRDRPPGLPARSGPELSGYLAERESTGAVREGLRELGLPVELLEAEALTGRIAREADPVRQALVEAGVPADSLATEAVEGRWLGAVCEAEQALIDATGFTADELFEGGVR